MANNIGERFSPCRTLLDMRKTQIEICEIEHMNLACLYMLKITLNSLPVIPPARSLFHRQILSTESNDLR